MTFNDFQDKITPAVSYIVMNISRHRPELTDIVATQSRDIAKSRFVCPSS
jgi:hypothetical protein